MTLLEVGNLGGLVVLMLGIMLGPPLLLTIIGFAIRKQYPKTAIFLFIFSGLYLLIGLGICGALIG